MGVDERAVELAMRSWLGGLIGPSEPGSLRAHFGDPAVATDAVEFTRNRFRQLFQNRASRSLPPIASMEAAIEEARAWCAAWTAEDFALFCWWIQHSSPWIAPLRGWQAKLLDAIADDLPSETLAGATHIAWKYVGNPQEFLLTARWRELFNRGGYVEDGQVARRPAGTLVLYRGSNRETRANWSWTSRYETAEIFRRQRNGRQGRVWVALVPWGNVLARTKPVATPRGSFDEYVVDTMRRDKPGWTIPIRPLDVPPRYTHWPHCRSGLAYVTLFTAHRCPECGAVIRSATRRTA